MTGSGAEAPLPDETADGPVNAGRLLRFGESLRATLEELRGLDAPLAIDRFAALVAARLEEADRILPPDLAAELRRLLAPGLTEGETDRDLMVILAQVDGWIAGLAGQMIVAVPEPPPG